MRQKRPPTFEVLPDVESLHFDEYLRLPPDERRRRDQLNQQKLSDPENREFVTGLFKMSMRPKKRSVKVTNAAKAKNPQ